MKLYCAKSPIGKLYDIGVCATRTEAWIELELMLYQEPYFASLTDIKSAAKRRGWRVVEVKVTEALELPASFVFADLAERLDVAIEAQDRAALLNIACEASKHVKQARKNRAAEAATKWRAAESLALLALARLPVVTLMDEVS